MVMNKEIMGPSSEKDVTVLDGKLTIKVRIAGNGPSLVYFHPAGGLYWDRFLDRLAERFTVYAPEIPGSTKGNPYAIHQVDNYQELILIYEELIRKLGIGRPLAVGQSMGGMMSLDLAATFPSIFSRVVALAPVGLWRDDAPILTTDLYSATADKIPDYLFYDKSNPAAQEMFRLPEDPEEIPGHVSRLVWTLGSTAKFLWPFPEQGIKRRAYRIDVPVQIIWGKNDKLVPCIYADEYKKLIKHAEVIVFDQCGHIPQMEKIEETLSLVTNFLGQ